jgi:hypothetical protein
LIQLKPDPAAEREREGTQVRLLPASVRQIVAFHPPNTASDPLAVQLATSPPTRTIVAPIAVPSDSVPDRTPWRYCGRPAGPEAYDAYNDRGLLASQVPRNCEGTGMAVYFYYGGESAPIALEQEGCFVVDDDLGRRWYCVRSPLADLRGYTPRGLHQATLDETSALQEKLAKAGHSPEPTTFGVITCADLDALKAQLRAVGGPGRGRGGPRSGRITGDP